MTVLTVAISLVLKELSFFLKIISVSSVELVARWTDWEHFEREQVKVCHLQHLSHFSLSTFDQTFQSTQKEKIRSDYLQSFYFLQISYSALRVTWISNISTVSKDWLASSKESTNNQQYSEQHQYLFFYVPTCWRGRRAAPRRVRSPRALGRARAPTRRCSHHSRSLLSGRCYLVSS